MSCYLSISGFIFPGITERAAVFTDILVVLATLAVVAALTIKESPILKVIFAVLLLEAALTVGAAVASKCECNPHPVIYHLTLNGD